MTDRRRGTAQTSAAESADSACRTAAEAVGTEPGIAPPGTEPGIVPSGTRPGSAAEAVGTGSPRDPVLDVSGLSIEVSAGGTWMPLVTDVSFAVARAGSTALIGESGCGKTMTAMSLLGLLPAGTRVAGGQAMLAGGQPMPAGGQATPAGGQGMPAGGQATPAGGQTMPAGTSLLDRTPRQLAAIRGRDVGVVFQEPMSTLDPTMQIGDQIAESRRLHLGESRTAARSRARELLDLVGIPAADARRRAYPHELSGGMQQRVGIAAAIACDPPLLIADEPTTALDVTVQAEILDLLRELRAAKHIAVLLVTHDLGVVADFCDDVIVMYAGGIAEQAPVEELFTAPRHPYTAALIASVPNGQEPLTPLVSLGGRVPPPQHFPPGCRFAPRCDYAREKCTSTDVYRELEDHRTRCLRVAAGEITLEVTR